MHKSDRLFQLTHLLRTYQPITAAQLAERMGLSVRTIYRYMDDLSVAGIPVYGEAGIGYRLMEGFELPPLTLTAQELEALMLGVKLVATRTGHQLGQAARALQGKIEAAVPVALARQVELQRFVRVPDESVDIMQLPRWDALYAAIANNQQLQIEYHSLQEQQSARQIQPLGLFYWGGKWTLGAWCFKRQQYRDFRVDRLTAVMTPAASLPCPAHISLADYLALKRDTTDTRLSAG
ncbi:YafY family protein [Bowmanella denitrificans]|uniref:YafY family protein n=1 Tax=Bowmanella denitrificans TaxID=366582 RepID=A0ABP3GMJ8_9ALTE